MAKLTDLPPEVLTTVFRQLLSTKLSDHDYLCSWDLEYDARETRATLYALCTVCKAFSDLALSFLYEQLFGWADLDNLLNCEAASDVVRRHMTHVRYLRLRIDALPGRTGENKIPTEGFRNCIAHCSKLVHLSVAFKGSSADASAFLLELARMPSLRNLQSLAIDLDSRSETHTIFRDLCAYTDLRGLRISFGPIGVIESTANPTEPLAHLRQLELDNICFRADIAAGMALASSNALEILEIWEEPAMITNITFKSAFGMQTWPSLTRLRWGGGSTFGRNVFVAHASQLPGLKHLHLDLKYFDPLEQLLPTLPLGLRSLWLGTLDQLQVLQALSSIKDGSWLGEGLQTIMLDFEEKDDPYWDEEDLSKELLLETAQEAFAAAAAKGVALEPCNLIRKLDKVDFWTRAPSIDSDDTSSTYSGEGALVESND